MGIKKSKTVFIEDSTAKEDVDTITVMQKVNDKEIFIGSIYIEHYKDKNKITYMAVDFGYKQIFNKTKNINVLKQKFIEYGETLAMFAPVDQNRSFIIIDDKRLKEMERLRKLINLRIQSKDREQEQEIDR